MHTNATITYSQSGKIARKLPNFHSKYLVHALDLCDEGLALTEGFRLAAWSQVGDGNPCVAPNRILLHASGSSTTNGPSTIAAPQ